MSSCTKEGDSGFEVESDPGVCSDQKVTGTFATDQTLAIPNQPRIREVQSIAEADTLNLAPGNTFVVREAPSGSTAGLREPVSNSHFLHAYQIDASDQRELGRGGIGRVVLVFDRTLGRDVAMKELLPEIIAQCEDSAPDASHAQAQRFLREARITGQLEHPNIVPVYELGRQPSGCLYYTMRVVRGRTLASAIRAATNLNDRLALVNHFAGLCQAIAYAHSRGVVHRDIKPENVMIGEFGETFVLDWGLANIVEQSSPHSLRAAASLSHPPGSLRRSPALSPGTAESFHTQFGSIVGTPFYMSPEQLLQQSDGCSPRSDVWSLGVVLYYILTGRLPYTATNLADLMLQLTTASLEPIVTVAPDAPRDLAAIAQRALTRDPRARYQNAREMARDITAYQIGEKVAAYDYTSLELIRRFAHRNRASVIIATTALATLLLLGIASFRRVSAARDAALMAERRANQGEWRAKSSLSDVLVERARSELAEGDAPSATLLAAGALELHERPDARGILIALANADRLEPRATPTFQHACDRLHWNPTLSSLACSDGLDLSIRSTAPTATNGRTYSAPNTNAYSLNASGWLLLDHSNFTRRIDADGAEHTLSTLAIRPGILACAKSGQYFAIVSDAGDLEILSMDPPITKQKLHLSYSVTALTFHPTEPILAIGGHRGELYLWRWLVEPTPLSIGNTHATVRTLAFAPRGGLLASGGSDGAVLLWETTQARLQLAPMRAASSVVDLSYSPNGAALAVTTRSGVVDVLETKGYERTLRSSTGLARIRQLAFSSNDDLVGVAEPATALRFGILPAVPRARYSARGNVLSLAWAANGTDILVAGLGEHGLCYLRLSDGECADRLPLRAGLVRKITYSEDRKLFVVAGTGGKLELWDTQTKLPRALLDVPIAEVRDLVFLPHSDRLVVGGNAPTLVTVDTSQFRVVAQQPLPGPVQSLTIVPQLQQLVIGLRSGHLLFRSLRDDRIESDLPLAAGWPVGLAVSTHRSWLVLAEDSGRISFIDQRSKRALHSFELGAGRITAFAFSDEDDLGALGGEGREIVLISTTDPPAILARLVEHQGTVRALLFDPTNHRLFSAGDDGTIRLWPLGPLKQSASALRLAAEREYSMRLEAGRIVRGRPR